MNGGLVIEEEKREVVVPNVVNPESRAGGARPAEDSDTLVPGSDPDDINQGCDYIFIKDVATRKMRQDKKKVRYVFMDNPSNTIGQHIQGRPDGRLLPVQEKNAIGESGQTPEFVSFDKINM